MQSPPFSVFVFFSVKKIKIKAVLLQLPTGISLHSKNASEALLANRAQLCSPENRGWRSPEHTDKAGDGVFPKQVNFYSSQLTFSFQLTTITPSVISSCFCKRSSEIQGNCTPKAADPSSSPGTQHWTCLFLQTGRWHKGKSFRTVCWGITAENFTVQTPIVVITVLP